MANEEKQGTASGGKLTTLLLLIILIAGIIFVAWTEIQRRQTAQQLEQTEQRLEEVRQFAEQRGAEAARGILERVREHIVIPDEPQPTVATIVNIEELRQQNEFYAQAKNGDHLIITETRAILYDPEENVIIDVVPVAIEPGALEEAVSDDGEEDEVGEEE